MRQIGKFLGLPLARHRSPTEPSLTIQLLPSTTPSTPTPTLHMALSPPTPTLPKALSPPTHTLHTALSPTTPTLPKAISPPTPTLPKALSPTTHTLHMALSPTTPTLHMALSPTTPTLPKALSPTTPTLHMALSPTTLHTTPLLPTSLFTLHTALSPVSQSTALLSPTLNILGAILVAHNMVLPTTTQITTTPSPPRDMAPFPPRPMSIKMVDPTQRTERLHQGQDASWRSKRESEAGQTAVDHLRLKYEKQFGATANLGHHINKVPPGRIPTNPSLLSKRPISKSAGEVTQANKASGYYVNTKNYANKHSGQYSSTKNLTKGGQGSGQQRSTAPQLPPRKHSGHPEIVKPKLKIPKSVERSAKTSIPNVKTPPPAKLAHRGVQRGNGEVRVTDQGFPSSPGTTPNSQDGKDVVDGMEQHTSRRIYIVPSHDPLQYHDPSHQHTLKEEAPWLRQDRELDAAKEELQALKDEKAQLEALQREKREAVSILEQEVVRQRDEIKKLRLEVNQLRTQPCEHNLEETKTLAAMKEKLHQETLQQEVKKREILQREMEQLTERMMEEQHQRESERLRESQVTAELRRQLREAREQLSERSEPPHQVPNTHTLADSQGLPNLGNSCYINAVMQCLFSITQLRLYFKEDRHKKELNMESEQGGEVATAFGNVFRVLETGKKPYGNLKDFQTVLCTHDDLFQPNLQQDAHELLACLLLWLHNDLSLVHQRRPQQYRQVDQGNNKSTNRGDHQTSSVINSLFQGVKESRIICPHTGSLLSSTTEIFRTLTLTVPGRDVCFLEVATTPETLPREDAGLGVREVRLCPPVCLLHQARLLTHHTRHTLQQASAIAV
ncbi:hypothetical protein Pcinc_019339 [Petrolisthes cinctipes]|uniref:ubiquitinyl hydrolase 1 n=1 Tax=Petrolisthes cinctipes TaxID=88211 RepID=A0AAE1FKC0_PETCI|nr:hypothetical protein Pcinc_019339 [Petrolisthes cinctipes]